MKTIISNQETRTITINGVSVEAELEISYDYETDSVDMDFQSKEDELETMARFANGELLNLVLFVKARALGVEGSDVLGACHIDATDFEVSVGSTVSDYGMIENALKELTEQIKSQAELLKPFA